MKKIALITSLITVLVLGALVTYRIVADRGTSDQPAVITEAPLPSPALASTAAASLPSGTATPRLVVTAVPSEKMLAVPYTLQAPFNVWDPVHEDACEEASLIMVKHFEDGTPIGTQEEADKEITALVAWGGQRGYAPSITLTELAKIAADHYGMHGAVKPATIAGIKDEVAQGKPVIVGLAGKKLGNPYFKNGGPNYHMLVIKGYDADGFVTNEPGTFHGDGYRYDYETIDAAIHDWNSTDILLGEKNYLVFN